MPFGRQGEIGLRILQTLPKLFPSTKSVQIPCNAPLAVGERRQSPAHRMPKPALCSPRLGRVEPVGKMWHHRGVPECHALVSSTE
jgi:hypothetical protein